jgi:formylmethanofuran dehydrogenase subunit C
MQKLFMASVALIVFATTVMIFQLTSCTKAQAQNTDCPPATYPITGLWEGAYRTDQVSHAPSYMSFTIYPDGSILKKGKVVNSDGYAYTRGRWTLNGDMFEYRDTTFSYSGGTVIERGTLKFKDDGTLSAGTWVNISGQTYTGTFETMKRVN